MIMRLRVELISDSTVCTTSDWFHAIFRAFFKLIGLFCCRVKRRPVRCEMKRYHVNGVTVFLYNPYSSTLSLDLLTILKENLVKAIFYIF